MTTMIAEVYDAFLEAGAGEAKARSAAEALAGHEDRFVRVEHRIETVEASLTRRIDLVETALGRRIDLVETALGRRIDLVEASLDRGLAEVGHKIDKVETRLRGEQVLIRWMFATLLTVVVAIALKLFLH